MKYIYTNNPIEQAANHIAKILIERLGKGERILWLLSGGSSIPIATIASKQLTNIDLSNLWISMTDERYGDVGHNDENWQQLLEDGLAINGANIHRPLINQDIEKTARALNDWLAEQIEKADYKIAIFGMGSDGHTCGIKPNSPAITSTALATGFTGDDFERITITFNAIKKIDEAVIQASGESKKQIISDILNKEIELNIQPAQILKIIPVSTIYTNNKENK